MPSINTLVADIYSVVEEGGGWDETISKYTAKEFQHIFDSRLSPKRTEHRPTLRLSAMGTPCKRKLWYSINAPDERETLLPSTLLKFLYGDLLEQLLISLAIAAGHDVQGMQDTLRVGGVKGHRDCVIDGITVDIKSAAPYSFKKFERGGLREDDPFGYISQLSSYIYAGRDHDVESHPTLGAFLVIDKVSGKICLDMYDFGPELDNKLEEIEAIKVMTADKENVPERGFEPVPEGKSGNEKLPMQCSYCGMKKTCYPDVRGFAYSNGPTYLTKVVKVPNVREFEVT